MCSCFFCVLIYTLHCLEAGSNLTDSCVAGEFVPTLLLPTQNTRNWRRAGVLRDYLMYIDDHAGEAAGKSKFRIYVFRNW